MLKKNKRITTLKSSITVASSRGYGAHRRSIPQDRAAEACKWSLWELGKGSFSVAHSLATAEPLYPRERSHPPGGIYPTLAKTSVQCSVCTTVLAAPPWTFPTFVIFCFSSWVKVFVVQSLSRVQLFATPWTAAHQAPLSFTVSWSWLKPMSIESGMPSSHLTLCCPFPSCPQSFPASGSVPGSRFSGYGTRT